MVKGIGVCMIVIEVWPDKIEQRVMDVEGYPKNMIDISTIIHEIKPWIDEWPFIDRKMYVGF